MANWSLLFRNIMCNIIYMVTVPWLMFKYTQYVFWILEFLIYLLSVTFSEILKCKYLCFTGSLSSFAASKCWCYSSEYCQLIWFWSWVSQCLWGEGEAGRFLFAWLVESLGLVALPLTLVGVFIAFPIFLTSLKDRPILKLEYHYSPILGVALQFNN